MMGPCLNKNIKITPVSGRVTVIFDGKVIASSMRAFNLDEPGSPPRVYIPREDVEKAVLVPSDHHTSCPFKGKASYHSLKTAAAAASDAVWYYADPCALVAPIKDHLAFWGNQIRYDIAPA